MTYSGMDNTWAEGARSALRDLAGRQLQRLNARYSTGKQDLCCSNAQTKLAIKDVAT